MTYSTNTYSFVQNSTLLVRDASVAFLRISNPPREYSVIVPDMLRRFIQSRHEFLPFVRKLPRDCTDQKMKGKGNTAAKKATTDGEEKKLDDLKLQGTSRGQCLCRHPLRFFNNM
jgi:hypothetical protein